MDLNEIVAQWVEFNFGEVINDVLCNIKSNENNDEILSIINSNKIHQLEEDVAKSVGSKKLKNILNMESDFSSKTDDDCGSQESFDIDGFDIQTVELSDIITVLKNGNETEQINALEILIASSAEELISQPSWKYFSKSLEKLLSKNINTIKAVLALKIFCKTLTTDSCRLVCEGFTTFTQVVINQIISINQIGKENSLECNFKERFPALKSIIDPGDYGEDRDLKNLNPEIKRKIRNNKIEILIKSMWLIVEVHKYMPDKWVRFNIKRIQEIIFSFFDLLETNCDSPISGLMILSIVDPKAKWCKHWLHGANGRRQFCLALKRHTQVLRNIVQIVLNGIYEKNYANLRSENTTSSTNQQDFKVDGFSIELSNKAMYRNDKINREKKQFSSEKSNSISKNFPSSPHKKKKNVKGNYLIPNDLLKPQGVSLEKRYEYRRVSEGAITKDKTRIQKERSLSKIESGILKLEISSRTFSKSESSSSNNTPRTSTQLPKILIHSAPSNFNQESLQSLSATDRRKCDETKYKVKNINRHVVSPKQFMNFSDNLKVHENKLRKIQENVEFDVLESISNEVVRHAMFCHCLSMITYLVQYRDGRQLFPINVSYKKRQLTLNDIVSSMTNFIQSIENNSTNQGKSLLYKNHISSLFIILKQVDNNLLTSRIK